MLNDIFPCEDVFGESWSRFSCSTERYSTHDGGRHKQMERKLETTVTETKAESRASVFLLIKDVILTNSPPVDLATPVVTVVTLLEHLLCQKYNRRPRESVLCSHISRTFSKLSLVFLHFPSNLMVKETLILRKCGNIGPNLGKKILEMWEHRAVGM